MKDEFKDLEYHTFQICGAYFGDNCFPSLNDLLNARSRDFKNKKTGGFKSFYGDMKKDFTTIAINAIRVGLRSWKPTKKVVPHFIFGEKNKGKKRDYDNVVSAARKIICDALVKSGYLEDDNPDYMEYGTNEFVYVDIPYIKVYLEEVEDE